MYHNTPLFRIYTIMSEFPGHSLYGVDHGVLRYIFTDLEDLWFHDDGSMPWELSEQGIARIKQSAMLSDTFDL